MQHFHVWLIPYATLILVCVCMLVVGLMRSSTTFWQVWLRDAWLIAGTALLIGHTLQLALMFFCLIAMCACDAPSIALIIAIVCYMGALRAQGWVLENGTV